MVLLWVDILLEKIRFLSYIKINHAELKTQVWELKC